MKIGIYPGSFDPITLGHTDIIKRSLKLVDKLIIGLGNNTSKNYLFTTDERIELILDIISEFPQEDQNKITIKAYNNLLVDFAQENNANTIIRGLRALSDFDFEFNMAGVNSKLNPNIDTIFLMATEKYQFISSKTVKELTTFNTDMSHFIHNKVMIKLKNKKNM